MEEWDDALLDQIPLGYPRKLMGRYNSQPLSDMQYLPRDGGKIISLLLFGMLGWKLHGTKLRSVRSILGNRSAYLKSPPLPRSCLYSLTHSFHIAKDNFPTYPFCRSWNPLSVHHLFECKFFTTQTRFFLIYPQYLSNIAFHITTLNPLALEVRFFSCLCALNQLFKIYFSKATQIAFCLEDALTSFYVSV